MLKKFFMVLILILIIPAYSYCENVKIDNAVFGKAYKLDNYASVTLLGFKFVNMYAQWDDGKASGKINKYCYDAQGVYVRKAADIDRKYPAFEECRFRTSGNEADFAWLKADIINRQKTEANFIKDITITVIYDDEYEYTGWVRQFNYDFSKSEIYSKIKDAGVIGWPVCLSPVDEMPISPMYKGHYAFGCTLPNYVIEDKDSPLRMIINIAGNEIIYNIR